MRLTLLRLLVVAVSAFLLSCPLSGQNCLPANINGSTINLACNQVCTNLVVQIPHIKSSSDYSVINVPYNPYPYLSATGAEDAILYNDDRYSNLVPLPFPFCFYDSLFTNVIVGSNGIITFDPSNGTGTCANAWPVTQPIPYAGGTPCLAATEYYPKSSIMGAYSDLEPSLARSPADRKISWFVVGTAPCRKFIVSFYHIGVFGTNCGMTTPNTFQIVLHESSGLVEVFVEQKACLSTTNGGRAILGIQNGDQSKALAAPGKNNTVWTENNTGYRFIPSGGGSRYVSSQLFTMGGVLLASADTSTVTAGLLNLSFPNICSPAGSTQYRIVTTFSACESPLTLLTSEDTITVNRPNTLNITATATNTICGPPSGTITATVPPGAGTTPYTFVLDGAITLVGNSPMTFNNVGPGPHTVVVTDFSGGCTGTIGINVNQVGTLTANLTPVATACPGVNNGRIGITPTNGSAPYTFILNPGAITQVGNTALFTGLAPGSYTITISDASGCITSPVLNATITTGAGLTAITSTSATSCQGANNGTATITPGNGSGPYSFVLDGTVTQTGATFTSFTNLSAGSHSVVITDASGCVSSPIIMTINAGPALVTTATHTNVLCNGAANGTITVTQPSAGIGPYEYSLNGTNWQTNNVFSGLVAGTYTVRFREANGCQGQLIKTVSQPVSLTATSAGVAVVCNGQNNGTITVNPNGGVMPYQYSIDAGATWQNSNTFKVAVGTYTVTIRDVNLCTTTQTVTITEPAVLRATATSTDATCNGGNNGTITISANGGNANYQYSVDGISFQASNVLNVAPGTYTATIKDNLGCTTTVTNIVVGLINDLTFSPATNPTICEGTSTQLQITSNALQYSWSPVTGLNNPAIYNPTANPVKTTNYTVTLTYGRCTATMPVTVNVNAAPIPDAGNDGFICYGQTYQLQASGGIEYSWAPATFLNSTTIADPVSTPDRTMVYALSVKGANGCSSVVPDSVTVDVIPPINVKTFPYDTVVYSGDQFQALAVSAATDYVWTPSTGLSNANIPDPIITTGAVGDVVVYKVAVSSPDGCKGEGYIRVRVYKGPDIYVPTGFTPNGDGTNDKFYPFPVGIKTIRSFKVFNRWGQMVYSTTKHNEGWDGKFSGKEQASAVYVWIVEGLTKDNKVVTKKGTIALIR